MHIYTTRCYVNILITKYTILWKFGMQVYTSRNLMQVQCKELNPPPTSEDHRAQAVTGKGHLVTVRNDRIEIK